MKNNYSAITWGLLAVLIWSAIPAFVKIGSTAETLPFLLVCRFLIASLLFAPFYKTIFNKVSQVPLKLWLSLTAILGANYYFQGLAMIDLPVSWYLIIFCLNPIFSLLFLGININRKTGLAIGLSVLGTLAFVRIDEVSQMKSLWPFLYITLGMFSWVFYTVVIKKFQTAYTNIETTALTQIISLVSCLVVWIILGSKVSSLNSSEVWAIMILGLSTPLAYFGFNVCLRQMPRFSVLSQYLEPVFGVIIGLMFFGESLSIIQSIGALLIIIATVQMG